MCEFGGLNLQNLLRFWCQEMYFLPIQIQKRLPKMKLAIRIIALTIVVAGAAAAATTPKTTPFVSHQSATGPLPRPAPRPDSAPGPGCGPGMPCAVEPAGK